MRSRTAGVTEAQLSRTEEASAYLQNGPSGMAALVAPVASRLLSVQALLLFALTSGEFALLIAISVPAVLRGTG